MDCIATSRKQNLCGGTSAWRRMRRLCNNILRFHFPWKYRLLAFWLRLRFLLLSWLILTLRCDPHNQWDPSLWPSAIHPNHGIQNIPSNQSDVQGHSTRLSAYSAGAWEFNALAALSQSMYSPRNLYNSQLHVSPCCLRARKKKSQPSIRGWLMICFFSTILPLKYLYLVWT